MEQAAADGKIRSAGLSNWYVEELTEFLPQVTVTPALVQNEIHPYYQENDVIPFIQDLGIVVQGWYPLGGRGHTSELLGMKPFLRSPQPMMCPLRRSFCAGICKRVLGSFPVPAIRSISGKIWIFLDFRSQRRRWSG